MGRRPEGHFWRKSTPASCSGVTLGLARAALNPRNPPATETGGTKPSWLSFPIYSFPDGRELEADGCPFIHSCRSTNTHGDPVLCQALSTQKWSLLSGCSQAEEAVDDGMSLAVLGWEGRPYSLPLGQVRAQRRGAGRGSSEEWEGSPGRRNSRNQGSEERLTWWRGFCDCCFCPPLDEAGFGGLWEPAGRSDLS